MAVTLLLHLQVAQFTVCVYLYQAFCRKATRKRRTSVEDSDHAPKDHTTNDHAPEDYASIGHCPENDGDYIVQNNGYIDREQQRRSAESCGSRQTDYIV